MISNLEKMGKDKSLLENAELGSAAIGASLMVMSASVELAANITQLSAVTKELQIKAAQRSLLAATIGMFAGIAELGYLYLYSKNHSSVPGRYLASNGSQYSLSQSLGVRSLKLWLKEQVLVSG